MSKDNNRNIIIKKASGETEPFDVSKLKASLKNAGADDDVTEKIAAEIEDWVYDDVTTGKIYARAYKMFRKQSGNEASRYKLKKALFSMGPTGYPFEHFIGELFKRQGYEVEAGTVMDGVTISHEMDVIATKNGKQHLLQMNLMRLLVNLKKYLHDNQRENPSFGKRKQHTVRNNFA